MANGDTKDKRKKVLIVGAGAAGMSCAHHLSQHPDRYAITLVDSSTYCGGQAFSIPLPATPHNHGAPWLNQGVQGGSPIFHHTLTMFARQRFAANPVSLHVSFGKGPTFWTNVFPTRLLARHQPECARFAWMLRVVRTFELVFALLPIHLLMKLFRFSDEFATAVALPMVALFLGTGNYTPQVPSMILERLFTSPTYGMWFPPEERSVAANAPPMVVFPNLGEFYEAWRRDLVGRGVEVRLGTEVTGVVRRGKGGVVVRVVKRTEVGDGHSPASAWAAEGRGSEADAGAEEVEERYDELVLCCLADTSKRVLGATASWREKRVLGAAKFSDDITITHSDAAYMRKHYENFYNADQAVDSLSGVDQTQRCEAAKKSFKPMYYIKQYERDTTKLEMCFDCTNYQAQFPPDVDFDDHVFQTIFLNKERDGHLWTDGEIDEAKVIRKDWWHQLCHSWTHYVLVVPWMWLLQGRRHTRFASSWTLLNAHEVAIMSGIAAAVDLGATYPEDLERDRFALLSFRLYYLLVYGKWYRKRAPKKGEGEDWATGLYGSVYKGPGLAEEERLMWKEEVKKGNSLQGKR